MPLSRCMRCWLIDLMNLWLWSSTCNHLKRIITIIEIFQARIQEKNEPPQNFPVSRFYPMFPRFFTTFPRFFTYSKFFKVCKSERCGSLNPRLYYSLLKFIYIFFSSTLLLKNLFKTFLLQWKHNQSNFQIFLFFIKKCNRNLLKI